MKGGKKMDTGMGKFAEISEEKAKQIRGGLGRELSGIFKPR